MKRTRCCLVTLVFFWLMSINAYLPAQRRPGAAVPAAQVARTRSPDHRMASARQVVQSPASSHVQSVGASVNDPEPATVIDENSMEGGAPLEESGDGGACDSCDEDESEGLFQPCPVHEWVQAEYLMWWPRPMKIPPLVTGGTTNSEGVLGQTGTETLVGGEVLEEMHSGVRVRVGMGGDPCHEFGAEVDVFYIGEATDRYSFAGTGAAGTGVIARPFFNVLTSTEFPAGREDAELVAFPGQLRGTVTVEATSQLYGVGVHGLRSLCQSCDCRPRVFGCGSTPVQRQFAGFLGWRHLNLQESLRINEDLTSLLAAPNDGRFLIEDRFETTNSFHGADLGFVWKRCRGRFSLDLLMRVAIGANHQNVIINGSTTVRGSSDAANNFENALGGILAQRTNIGKYTRNRIATVPELGVTLGYDLSPQWKATVGYTFLYWSGVVRPGDQIDREVNPNLFPPETTPFTGLESPTFRLVDAGFWVNGLNLGLERTW